MKKNIFLLLFYFNLFIFSKEVFAFNFYGVSSGADSGPNTLRQAILDANASGAAADIMLGNAPIPLTIKLTSPLPVATVHLNFMSYSGATITIDGSNIISDPVFPYQGTLAPALPTSNTTSYINLIQGIISVTNTNSSGDGSLSKAIDYANQTGMRDYIYFAIPGSGPFTISSITTTAYNPVIIDGSSQSGHTAGNPVIEITGKIQINASNSEVYGLKFNNKGELVFTVVSGSDNFTVGKSTAPNIFINNSYLEIEGRKNGLIQNNYFGTDASDNLYNSYTNEALGIYYTESISVINNAFADGAVIRTQADTLTIIKKNRFGVNSSGDAPLGKPIHLRALTFSLKFGGSVQGEGNIFIGGMQLWGGNIILQGNKIGTDVTGMSVLGPGLVEMLAIKDSTIIGGSTSYERNIIADALMLDECKEVYVYNNYIGVAADGISVFANNNKRMSSSSDFPNISAGIAIYTIPNTIIGTIEIGKAISGYGNIIAGYENGIYTSVQDKVTIAGNKIFNNSHKGINLNLSKAEYGWKPGNDSILSPQIKTISGNTISGIASPNAIVHIYYSEASDPVLQGKDYIGLTIANANGEWTFTNASAFSSPCLLTATATTSSCTSEFAESYFTGNAGPDLSVCKGKSVNLNSTGGVSYNWSPSDYLDQTNVANPISTPLSGLTYYVDIVNALGCTGSDTLVVNVTNPLPDPIISLSGDTLVAEITSGTIQWFDNTNTALAGADSTKFLPLISGQYYVQVTDNNGCTSVSQPFLVTGIYNNLNNLTRIALKPNPSQGGIKIDLPDYSGSIVISLIDTKGQKMYYSIVENEKELMLDFSSIPRGIYFLKLEANENIYTEKLILN